MLLKMPDNSDIIDGSDYEIIIETFMSESVIVVLFQIANGKNNIPSKVFKYSLDIQKGVRI